MSEYEYDPDDGDDDGRKHDGGFDDEMNFMGLGIRKQVIRNFDVAKKFLEEQWKLDEKAIQEGKLSAEDVDKKYIDMEKARKKKDLEDDWF